MGFLVDGIGLMNTEERVDALRRMKFSGTLQQLERWIGMVGWLRHLIPRLSSRIALLQDRKTLMLEEARNNGRQLVGSARKRYTARKDFNPTQDEEQAFRDVTNALAEAGMRFHSNPVKRLFIQLDASKEHGMGAMVFHLADGHEWDPAKRMPATAVQPILFLSRSLKGGEPRYWPTELEMACLVWVVRKLRTLITSSRTGHIVISTDHATTCGIVKQKSLFTANMKTNDRLVIAPQWLSQFPLQVFHIPG